MNGVRHVPLQAQHVRREAEIAERHLDILPIGGSIRGKRDRPRQNEKYSGQTATKWTHPNSP
jgi:hypothetical protein